MLTDAQLFALIRDARAGAIGAQFELDGYEMTMWGRLHLTTVRDKARRARTRPTEASTDDAPAQRPSDAPEADPGPDDPGNPSDEA